VISRTDSYKIALYSLPSILLENQELAWIHSWTVQGHGNSNTYTFVVVPDRIVSQSVHFRESESGDRLLDLLIARLFGETFPPRHQVSLVPPFTGLFPAETPEALVHQYGFERLFTAWRMKTKFVIQAMNNRTLTTVYRCKDKKSIDYREIFLDDRCEDQKELTS
jgi:hypothetical protein